MKIKTLIWLAVAACLCLSCVNKEQRRAADLQWLNAQDSLTVAVFPYYAPYQFKNKKGAVDGLLIDYLGVIEEEMGYSFKKVEYKDWPLLMRHAKQGKLDVILEIQSNEERLKYLEFHDLFIESRQVLVSRKSDSIKSLDNLKNKTVILPAEYAIIKELKAKELDIKVATTTTDSTAMRLLSSGLHDAYIGPRAVVNHNKSKMRLNNLAITKILPLSYKPQVAVTKENERLNAIMSRSIADISFTKKEQLINRWLFSEIEPFYLTTDFWINVGWVLLIILLAAIGLNIFLRHRVKERTKALLQINQDAIESQNLRGQFTQNISHEIRTPMNGVMGFAGLLQRRPTHGTERHRYLQTIKESGSRLEDVASKIFEVAKIQENKTKIERDHINVKSLLEELVARFENTALRKDIDINLTIPQKLEDLQILLDRKKLTAIIKGLVDNAIKFTDEGIVQIRYDHDGYFLTILISDTGVGISQLDKKRMFTSLSQLHQKISQGYNGLGLGLTIAMEHAILLDGTISFNSKKDKGSVFQVKIPCARIDSAYFKTQQKV